MTITEVIDAMGQYSSGGGGTPSPYTSPNMDPVANGSVPVIVEPLPTPLPNTAPVTGCNPCAPGTPAPAPAPASVPAVPVTAPTAAAPSKVEQTLRGLPWWIVPLGLLAFAGVVDRG